VPFLIIIINDFTFSLVVYNYKPETNHVPTVYNVATILLLQYMAYVMPFSVVKFCTLTLVLSEVCERREANLDIVSAFSHGALRFRITQMGNDLPNQWLQMCAPRIPFDLWIHFGKWLLSSLLVFVITGIMFC
jgi:hypothetical protein